MASKAVNGLLNKIRKKSQSTNIGVSKGGSVEEWISTGSLALNRICSGSIHKGIPAGRVVIFAGPSSSGKSLMAANIASNALHLNNYDLVFYFDSEGGGMKEFFEGRGCDPEKIEHILLDSVEDATIQILNVYNEILEHKKDNPDFKALAIVDSVGALVPKKLITDAAKGKQVQDMGARAKLVNNLVKGCTIPALKSDMSIIFVNHTYDDPAAMFNTKIKQQGGGKGLMYQCSLNIQTGSKLEKNEGEDEGFYSGNILKFLTVKNRYAQPFKETEVYIDFSTGVSKYHGLLDVAIAYGYIEQKGAYYLVPSYSDKMIRKKVILDGEKADDIWNTFIDALDKKSQKELSYSSETDSDDVDTEVDTELLQQTLQAAKDGGSKASKIKALTPVK